VKPLLDRAYLENVTLNPQLPSEIVPRLLPPRRPSTGSSRWDVFLPGCPPSADLIYTMLDDLLSAASLTSPARGSGR